MLSLRISIVSNHRHPRQHPAAKPAVRRILSLLVLISSAVYLHAQSSNATLNGQVTANGAAVKDASITVTNTQTGIQQSELTDDTGIYTILNLAPGFYDLQASQEGFATVVRRN